MGEIVIPAKFNAHKIYKKMMFLNPYRNVGGSERGDFIFTVETTAISGGSSNSKQFKLPLIALSTVDCIVEWGDGSIDSITSYDQVETTHTYPEGGEYEINISGVFNGWQFNFGGDRFKIRVIKNWGIFEIINTDSFDGCGGGLTITATDAPIISTNDLTDTFRTGYSIDNIGDLSQWNPSSHGATNMSRMFEDCISFNQDIGSWDMTTVTNISYMLSGCRSFNQDISSWNLQGVSSLKGLLRGTLNFRQDISTLNISTIISLERLFQASIIDDSIGISEWDISGVRILRELFYGSEIIGDNINIENWDTGNVTDMFAIFLNCKNFNMNLANWNIENCTNFKLFTDGAYWTTTNYDATLIGWASQSPKPNVTAEFGIARYTLGGAAETARNTLINTYGWIIEDGGGI